MNGVITTVTWGLVSGNLRIIEIDWGLSLIMKLNPWIFLWGVGNIPRILRILGNRQILGPRDHGTLRYKCSFSPWLYATWDAPDQNGKQRSVETIQGTS